MIEHCANNNCKADIKFDGMTDPQSLRCPVCGGITFRYTWDMCMSSEEIATENLVRYTKVWFDDHSWLPLLPVSYFEAL
jgi:hypothetical protein